MTSYEMAKSGSAASIILRNIAVHLEERIGNWFMASMTLGVGIVLTINPVLLTGSPNAAIYFGQMNNLADQWVWRALFLMCGASRLTALAINGSFPAFTWTPMIRLVMSTLSAFLWAQIAWSLFFGPATIGTVVYFGLVVFEAYNALQALKDTRGRGDR